MHLFDSFACGPLFLRNRIAVAPMCQYSARDGMPGDWHLVHLGSRAVGGAGLVFTEATAVAAQGRISPGDTGIWTDAQAEAWTRIARFIAGQGAVAGMQLAHAGRKAATDVPWRGGKPLDEAHGGWPVVAPSAVAFDAGHATPQALNDAGLAGVVADFRAAAERAVTAGFEVLEIHAAHGYLLHEFLSPLSNRRADRFGGNLANRSRLLLEVVAAVREVSEARASVWVRLSATDWVDAGWNIDECVQLARWLRTAGVDVVDCSSGGNVPHASIPAAPGYQVPFAARIRRQAGIATGAVGMITTPEQAADIVAQGDADVVLLGREFLRDAYFPRRAGVALGRPLSAPDPYARGW